MDIERTIDIAAPADRIWSILTDVERWPEWTESMTRLERLDTGPLAPGTRVRIRQPRLPVVVWTVQSVEPGRSFVWRHDGVGLHSVAGHSIEVAESGARVTLSLAWEGWLAPLIRRIYGELSRRYVDLEAQGLKRRCESG